MKLLITGADNALGQATALQLSHRHEVRLTGRTHRPDALRALDYTLADLRSEPDAAALTRAVDAVLHLEPYGPGTAEPASELLDIAARGTYQLLRAARSAGVARAVLGSTLALLAGYPAGYVVDETWEPQPPPEPVALAPWMSELTAREFAREGGIEVVCLRFDADADADAMAAARTAQALEAALAMQLSQPGYRWALFHVSASERFASMMPSDPLRMHEATD